METTRSGPIWVEPRGLLTDQMGVTKAFGLSNWKDETAVL